MSERDRKERARHLLMAGIDGELSADDRAELERMLESDAELRREWDRLRQVKEVTEEMGYREPPPEVWEDYWTSVYNRAERGLGWVLVSTGTLLLIGYGVWQALAGLLADHDLPATIKLAVFALLFGLAVLLYSVLREKWFTRKSDPYRGIQR